MTPPAPPRVLARPEWLAARADYARRVGPWAAQRSARRTRGEKHPVYDFLFEYYSFTPGQLARWSPGLGVVLADAAPGELDWPRDTTATPEGHALDAGRFPPRRLDYLRWAVNYLEQTGAREPLLACFGLHEWAMVYREPEVRHARVPLRLGGAGTDAVVEAGGLCCTHFDAFRFFSAAAAPRNRHALTRPQSSERDQPGCVHVTMDLYRFAYKVAPFVSGGTLAAAFDLARRARELDMRASPYDLAALGFPPIAVETRAGREEYVEAQRQLLALARPVRTRLLAEYRALLAAAQPASTVKI